MKRMLNAVAALFVSVASALAAVAPVSSGLKVWIAADQIPGAVDGAEITSWPDLSGNGSDFSVPSGFTAPTFSAIGINGRPAVRFTDSDILDCANVYGTPYTIFTVCRMHGSRNGRLVTSSTQNWLIGYHGGGWQSMYAEGWVRDNQPNVPTTPQIFSSCGDGSYTAFTHNGALVVQNSNGVYGPGRLSLGGGSSWKEYSDGDVAEILLFDRVLTAEEQQSVGAYLQLKYGIEGAYKGLCVANTVNGGMNYISGASARVVDFPSSEGYDQYQVTIGEASEPVDGAWAAIPASVAAVPDVSFEPPANGDIVFFRAWLHDSSGTLDDVAYTCAITYCSQAPVAVARDVTVVADAANGRDITVTDIDAGSHDDMSGIASMTVSPAHVTVGENQVTLTIVNNAGLSASATATVTGVAGTVLPQFNLDAPEGLVLHLDASTLGLADGASVSTWPDLSGEGNNAVQQPNFPLPTYVSDGMDGRPAVRFQPVDNVRPVLVTDTAFSNPYTAFAVSRLLGTCNQRLIGGWGRDWIFGYHGGCNERFYAEGWVHNSGTFSAAPQLYAATCTGALSAFYSAGTLLDENNGGVCPPSRVGLGAGNGGGEPADGDISEVLVFDRVLDAGELAVVGSYLQSKYGIAGAYPSFVAANPITGGTDYTCTNSVRCAIRPPMVSGAEYQATLSTDPASLDPDAWKVYDTSVAPVLDFPIPASNGMIDVTLWVRTWSYGTLATNSYTDAIEYTTATCATPTATDVSLMLGQDGTRAISAEEIDNGSSDQFGIASRSVSPATIGLGENIVTLTVVNNAGASASTNVVVTGTPYSPRGEIDISNSFPLPHGYLTHLLHLGANFDTDYINTAVPGVGGADNDQLAAFGGQANQHPKDGDVYENVPGATTANGSLVWTEMTISNPNGLWCPYGDNRVENYIKYWQVYIIVPGKQDRDVVFRHFNDDGLRVWVNGELQVAHGGSGGEFATNGRLYAGVNAVTIKLQEGGGGDYMALRITDTAGNYFSDLRYMLTPFEFQLADPTSGSYEFTSTNILDIAAMPELDAGARYQTTLSTNAASLDGDAWTYYDTDNPPTKLAVPFTSDDLESTNTVVLWSRTFANGVPQYRTWTIDMFYTASAPVAIARDAAIPINATTGTTVDPAWIDGGSYDDVSGIKSMSVSPAVVYGPTQVTLYVMNNAGIVSTATANITTDSWLDAYISPDGSDTDGTGRPESPWRTFTHALASIEAGGVVYAEPGLYDADAGEEFPITIAKDVTLVGTDDGRVGAGVRYAVIDAGNTTENVMVLDGADFALSGIQVCDSTGPAIVTRLGSYAFSNCLFTQSKADTTYGWMTGIKGAFDCFGGTYEFDSCCFTGITRYAVVHFNAGSDGSLPNMVFRDSLFAENYSMVGTIACFNPGGSLKLERCVFRHNQTPIQGVHDCAACTAVYMAGPGQRIATFSADRCVFEGGVGGNVIGLDYCPNPPNAPRITNCLFVDNDTRSGVFQGYDASVDVYNSTFIRNFGAYTTFHLITRMHNCILYHEGMMSYNSPYAQGSGNGTALALDNSIVWQCGDGDGWSKSTCENLIEADPFFVNADVPWDDPLFDASLRPYSPAIDAGDSSFFADGAFPLDVAGNARLADNDADGVAAIDLGAYESLFGAAVVPTFQIPAPGAVYALRGVPITIPVTVSPAADGPVTAAIAYPEGITGPATIDFEDGAGPVELTVTPLAGTTNEMVRLTISESGTSQGVVPFDIDVFISDSLVSFGAQSPIFVLDGETVDVPVSLASDGVLASSRIAVTLSSVIGDGSNAVTWDGGAYIEAGDHSSTGTLHIVGGSGASVAEITIGSGFTFVESGSDTIEVTIVGYPGYVYVDPEEGDDEDGIGTLDAPFQSITRAVELVPDDAEIRLLPGTYTPATESFPIQPGTRRIIGWSALGEPDRGDYVITGGNEASSLFSYTCVEGGSIANATLCETTGAAVFVDASTFAATNALFTQSVENLGAAGAISFENDSVVEVVGCEFTGIRRVATVLANLAAQNHYGKFTVRRCLFKDNHSEWGTIATYAIWKSDNVAGHFYLYDTDMVGNSVTASTGALRDSFRAAAVFATQYGNFVAERCRFLGNTEGCLFGLSYMRNGNNYGSTFPVFRDCLIAGNDNPAGVFDGAFSDASLYNCTLVDNRGGYNCFYNTANFFNSIVVGGTNSFVRPDGNHPGAYAITCRDSIMWNTVDGQNILVWNGSFNQTNTIDELSTNLRRVDPLLRNISVPWNDAAFDARLRAGSPARDTGNNANVASATDLDGLVRIRYGTPTAAKAAGDPIVDLGCYECDPVNLGTMIIVK